MISALSNLLQGFSGGSRFIGSLSKNEPVTINYMAQRGIEHDAIHSESEIHGAEHEAIVVDEPIIRVRQDERISVPYFDPKNPPKERTLLGGAHYPHRVNVQVLWAKYGWRPTFAKETLLNVNFKENH